MLSQDLQYAIAKLSPDGKKVVAEVENFYQNHYNTEIRRLEHHIEALKSQLESTSQAAYPPPLNDNDYKIPPENINISIVEDNQNYREWIEEEINSSPNMTCISSHSTAEDALTTIRELQPDLVIMDLHLEGSKIGGIECMLTIKLEYPNIQFLVISSLASEEMIFNALKVGAGAYLQKRHLPKKLVELILDFMGGNPPMSPGIAQRVIKAFQFTTDDLALFQDLTARESEVLSFISKGLLNKEIADQLGITEGVIKQHTTKIYNKLQVYNRVEAVLKYHNRT